MTACKVCGGAGHLLGHLDFNRTCWDRMGPRVFPVSDERVAYYACPDCGFLFTPHCDGWSDAEFAARIYNADYAKADPDPGLERGGVAATGSYWRGALLADLLDGGQETIRLLDFGAGGDPGYAGQALTARGFRVTSYDPFLAPGTVLPNTRFDVVYAIEVIEHCVDVQGAAAQIAGHLDHAGLLYLATMLHPFPTPDDVLASWYIAPRNGHISVFSQPALEALFAPYGIELAATELGVFGFRSRPRFPCKLFG